MEVFRPKTSLKIGQRGKCQAKDAMGRTYVTNVVHGYRVVADTEDEGPWVRLYQGRSRVFDCNPQFFEAHFELL